MPNNDPEDVRVHHVLRPDDGGPADVALLGAPFDSGVALGGGRAGAAEGPAAIRRMLQRAGTVYHLEHDVSIAGLRVVDAGDVSGKLTSPPRPPSPKRRGGSQPAEEHAALEAAVAALLARGIVPIVLGGGHDLTFATVAALARRHPGPVGGVNIDAHLDVRPLINGRITSGTPFRRILETLPNVDGSRLVVLGPHGNRNAKAHVDWLRGRGGHILTLAEARRLGAESAMAAALARACGVDSTRRHGDTEIDAVFVSLDIDSAAQAYAPGCSAPSPDGFRPEELLQFAFLAGRHASVACFDVMEVNPRYDLDDRTAALAAAAVVHFLFGLAVRKRTM